MEQNELNLANIDRMIQHIQEELEDERIHWIDWFSCFSGMAWRLDGAGSPNVECCAILESFFGVTSSEARNLAYMEGVSWDMFDQMSPAQQHSFLIDVLERLRDTGVVRWGVLVATPSSDSGGPSVYSWS